MAGLDVLFRSPLLVSVLRLVLHERGPFTVEEVAERTDAPYPTVAKEVRRLEEAGVLVVVEVIGRTKLVDADRTDAAVRALTRTLLAADLGPLPQPEGGDDDMSKKKDKKKDKKKKKK